MSIAKENGQAAQPLLVLAAGTRARERGERAVEKRSLRWPHSWQSLAVEQKRLTFGPKVALLPAG